MNAFWLKLCLCLPGCLLIVLFSHPSRPVRDWCRWVLGTCAAWQLFWLLVDSVEQLPAGFPPALQMVGVCGLFANYLFQHGVAACLGSVHLHRVSLQI